MSTNKPIKIVITALKPTDKGTPYTAHVDGQLIVSRSYAPSFAACRWLAANGFSGSAEVWSPGEQHPRMTIGNIHRAARFSIRENERHGPKVTPYEPYAGPTERRSDRATGKPNG